MSQYVRNTASLLARPLANIAGPTSAREVISRVARRHGLAVRDLLPVNRSGRPHPHAAVLVEAVRAALALQFSKTEIASAIGRKSCSVRWMLGEGDPARASVAPAPGGAHG